MSHTQSSHLTELTSRAALSQDEAVGGVFSPQHEQVQRLHEVVRGSLGDFELCPSGTRRRKLDNAPMEVDTMLTDIPFRLISWTLPVQPIRLMPAHHSGVRYQRPVEDTVNEAEMRQLRAQEAAVDADLILACSRISVPKAISMGTGTLVLRNTGTDPSQLPNLLVTEGRRSSTSISASTEYEKDLKFSCVKCCPLVPVSDQIVNGKPKRKRKKKKKAVQNRPPPHFFRPMQEWGGKSAGYAMGWRSSWPVNRTVSHYMRDKMGAGSIRSSRLD